MPTLLVNNIQALVTMDPARREIPNGTLFIRDHIIEQVGTTTELPQTADKTLELQGRHIVLPGFVNTHITSFKPSPKPSLPPSTVAYSAASKPCFPSGQTSIRSKF
jgi:predicted amidohydrolase